MPEMTVEMRRSGPAMPVEMQRSAPVMPVEMQRSAPVMPVEMQRSAPVMPVEMQRSASDMVNRCFRHQHPEAYGRPEMIEASVPTQLRYGVGEAVRESAVIPEEPMGDPDAVPLT